MAPSMTRATIVLELQSNTPLFATVRVNKAAQKEYVNPLCMRDAVMRVNNVSTGRWTAASDDGIACLELHFWRQRDERSTDVAVPSSWTEPMYRRAMDTTIKDAKGISILPAIQCWNALYDRSSTRAITNPNTTIKHKTVGCGSRSVRDSSTFGRLVIACNAASSLEKSTNAARNSVVEASGI
jgi:hypothetical protein